MVTANWRGCEGTFGGPQEILVPSGVADYVGVQPGAEGIVEFVYNGPGEPIIERFDGLRLIGTFDMAGPDQGRFEPFWRFNARPGCPDGSGRSRPHRDHLIADGRQPGAVPKIPLVIRGRACAPRCRSGPLARARSARRAGKHPSAKCRLPKLLSSGCSKTAVLIEDVKSSARARSV